MCYVITSLTVLYVDIAVEFINDCSISSHRVGSATEKGSRMYMEDRICSNAHIGGKKYIVWVNLSA